MKKCILCSCIFIAFTATAQKITFYDWRWMPCNESQARFVSRVEQTDSGWLRSDIYLATKKLRMEELYKDSNCQVPIGTTRSYYTNQRLQSESHYSNGILNGPLITYHYNGMIKDSVIFVNGAPTGTLKSWHSNGYLADSVVNDTSGSAVQVSWFDNGKPSGAGKTKYGLQEGKWRYFHRNGNTAALEEYKAGKLLSRIYFDEEGMQVTDTSNRDRPAMFRGSDRNDRWIKYMENNLEWPPHVKLVNTDTVTVTVVATIDEKGNVTDAYVEVPFDPLFDNGVLRVIKRSPKWTPAISHNRYVKDLLIHSVNFYAKPKNEREQKSFEKWLYEK